MDLSVYFICTPELCAGRSIEEVVTAAVKGGITMLQLRDKSDQALENAKRLKALDLPIPLIINDHVEIAHAIEADGIHIGQGDMDATQARDILGPSKIIGLTAFTPEHMAAIDPKIVDYVGTGPFYETQTDKGKPVLGAERFTEIIKQAPVPVVGIGGITPENAPTVLKTGADGIAMMRSISEAQDVETTARKFKGLFHD